MKIVLLLIMLSLKFFAIHAQETEEFFFDMEKCMARKHSTGEIKRFLKCFYVDNPNMKSASVRIIPIYHVYAKRNSYKKLLPDPLEGSVIVNEREMFSYMDGTRLFLTHILLVDSNSFITLVEKKTSNAKIQHSLRSDILRASGMNRWAKKIEGLVAIADSLGVDNIISFSDDFNLPFVMFPKGRNYYWFSEKQLTGEYEQKSLEEFKVSFCKYDDGRLLLMTEPSPSIICYGSSEVLDLYHHINLSMTNELGSIVNYIYQGKGVEDNKELEILGQQILQKEGRYDEKKQVYIPFEE